MENSIRAQEQVKYVSAAEFAETHTCDPDWVAAMGSKEVPILKQGQKGKTTGYDATVVRHFANGMYEVRVPGGICCISYSDFEFDGKV